MANEQVKNQQARDSISAPLITVYIANFNYERYLQTSIESVLEQTFQNFELIIIDDGSTDNSRTMIEKYESSPRVIAIYQHNKGLPATCNVALKLARGKYLMRLDADDFLDPHALEIMSAKLERESTLALVYPDYYLVDEDGNIEQQVRWHDAKDVTLWDHPAHGACTMFRRSVLQQVGGYDESFTCQDGVDIWMKITAQHAVSNINLPLFYYRKHSTNLTRDEQRLFSTQAEIYKREVEENSRAPLSVLAIVPVRGSGMDPRSSPLRKLGDKSLIDWTLDAAFNSRTIENILVTTPDEVVLEHIRDRYGDRVLLHHRDQNLARINTRLDLTLFDSLDFYRQSHGLPDAIVSLFVESPFRSSVYIDKAIHTMQIYDVDLVEGVRPVDEVLYVNSGKGLKLFQANPDLRLERESVYQRAGGLQLVRRESIDRSKNWMSNCTISHVIMDQRAAFTIRSETDWQIAEHFAQEGS